jgi:hypothetical protein
LERWVQVRVLTGIAAKQNKEFEIVIASEAKQSRDRYDSYGLLRRFAPRNDGKYDPRLLGKAGSDRRPSADWRMMMMLMGAPGPA